MKQEGNGFLTTNTLKEILRELDPKLSEVGFTIITFSGELNILFTDHLHDPG